MMMLVNRGSRYMVGQVMKKTLLGLFGAALLMMPTAVWADYVEDDFQAWQIMVVNGHIGKLLLYGDVQNNTDLQDVNNLNHEANLLIRPAIGYQLPHGFSIWQGYGYTPAYQPAFRTENQLWQQLMWQHKFKHFNYVNRLRLEDRFIDNAGNTCFRLRELNRVGIPIGKTKWLISAFDEAFVNLNNADNMPGPRSGFDQNWAFIGLARRLNPHVIIESGYLNNYINRRGPGAIDRMNHVWWTGFNFNIN